MVAVDEAGQQHVLAEMRGDLGAKSRAVSGVARAVGSEFDLIPGAAALALDALGLGVVRQPVQQGRGEDGVVVDDAGPLLAGSVEGGIFIILLHCRIKLFHKRALI